MLRIKPGVKVGSLRPETILGIVICERAYAKHGIDMWLTSAVEGNHCAYSDHYKGIAWDIRNRNIPSAGQRQDILMTMRDSLGEDYLVLDEEDHFHVSYRPVGFNSQKGK